MQATSVQSRRIKELFTLGTFEGKSSDSVYLMNFVNRRKLYAHRLLIKCDHM
jgi:hypothetical protein